MTLNRTHPRARSRWLGAATIVAALMIVTAGLSYAAVFGDDGDTPYVFELDGDAIDPIVPSGTNRNLPDDWSAIFPLPADTPVGFLDKSFTDDHSSIDETYFTGGSSKDDIDIDTTPASAPTSGGWMRDKTSSAQAKADIIDAFAASYLVGGDTVVYFGMDRFSNDGATFAGFWFLQNGISYGPTANNGVGEIHGVHEVGDILVITDFTQGGAVEKLNVYEWVGAGNGAINGVFNLKFAGTDCSKANSTDDACTIVNKDVVDSPWPFVPAKQVGPPNKFQPGLFIEGGINISQLFPGEDPCFTNFVAETRASFSVDSTLSDFTKGSFNTCGGIEALKYHDKNANGSRDADGADNVLGGSGAADDEVPLSGWTIFIDGNGNETLDTGETSGVTGSDGKVTFSSLPTGTYSVCEVLQTNWFNSDPTGTTLCESATVGLGGAVAAVDFGNYQNVSLKVQKYHDKNANGSRDAGEVLLSGWNFYIENGSDEVRDAATDGALQATDSSGETTLTLTPGKTYKICEVLQANWVNSDPGGGTICESTQTILSGTAASDLVFGNYPEYRLIVLTCSEASGELVVSTVDLDGSGTTYSAKDTIGTPPALSGKTTAELQAYLCNLGGAQYEDLAPQTFNSIRAIMPKAS